MDNIYSAYHYACKTKADKEAIEQIYEEVKKSAQNAIYRNIGDIFFTARTDTEINGAVECNGGTYNTADFEGKQNVGNLLASGSLPYVSLSEYESLVSANGSCRAFGWDGGDSFRVPTIPALLLNKEQAAVVGNGIGIGITDGSSSCNITSLVDWNGSDAGGNALKPANKSYGKEVGSGANYDGYSRWGNGKIIGITTDATKSGIVANLDVIEYRAMVQLASGATDQAVITATSALQQIANKVDRDEADYVVESYKSDTTHDWYRVYKSGWVEQGGVHLVNSTGWDGVTLLKPMKDNKYNVLAVNSGTDTTRFVAKVGGSSKNTTTTVYLTMNNVGSGIMWKVCGQGA